MIAALLIYVFALPHLLESLIGLSFVAKLLISASLLVPLGFAMGMPFPSGLRALASSATAEESRAKHGAIEWAWAMNAASSVLGSVLAIVDRDSVRIDGNVDLWRRRLRHSAALAVDIQDGSD